VGEQSSELKEDSEEEVTKDAEEEVREEDEDEAEEEASEEAEEHFKGTLAYFFVLVFLYELNLSTVGAISLERREKFRAQIQSLLLTFMVKLESCALEQLYRDTCWGRGWFFIILT
jgi:hypothetical protein